MLLGGAYVCVHASLFLRGLLTNAPIILTLCELNLLSAVMMTDSLLPLSFHCVSFPPPLTFLPHAHAAQGKHTAAIVLALFAWLLVAGKLCMCVCACVCVCVWMYVCVYVCMYVRMCV